MASDAKKKRPDCGPAVDRISVLPRNLIELILDCLPIHDAARTSSISKTWKNVWDMHPHLVFDDGFFSQLVSRKDTQSQLSEVSTTITTILLLHSGPVTRFHLSIPQNFPFNRRLDIDLWIKNVSRNGVREFELHCNKPLIAYKMHSYLFSCSELTHLRLTNCILNPPLIFGGFCYLISVELVDVIINANISFGTRLEELVLRRCTGIQHLGCQFKYNNNLSNLSPSLMDQLETVVIRGVMGSRAEIRFIKFLLGSSPSLRCMELSKNTTIDDPEEDLGILGELVQFPRASAVARIIWTTEF